MTQTHLANQAKEKMHELSAYVWLLSTHISNHHALSFQGASPPLMSRELALWASKCPDLLSLSACPNPSPQPDYGLADGVPVSHFFDIPRASRSMPTDGTQ